MASHKESYFAIGSPETKVSVVAARQIFPVRMKHVMLIPVQL